MIVCDDAVYLMMKMKSEQETRRQLNWEERRQNLEQEENNDSWGSSGGLLRAAVIQDADTAP